MPLYYNGKKVVIAGDDVYIKENGRMVKVKDSRMIEEIKKGAVEKPVSQYIPPLPPELSKYKTLMTVREKKRVSDPNLVTPDLRKKAEEFAEKNYTQQDYNILVNAYMKQGHSKEEAERMAKETIERWKKELIENYLKQHASREVTVEKLVPVPEIKRPPESVRVMTNLQKNTGIKTFETTTATPVQVKPATTVQKEVTATAVTEKKKSDVVKLLIGLGVLVAGFFVLKEFIR